MFRKFSAVRSWDKFNTRSRARLADLLLLLLDIYYYYVYLLLLLLLFIHHRGIIENLVRVKKLQVIEWDIVVAY